jgi:hypothetical protein
MVALKDKRKKQIGKQINEKLNAVGSAVENKNMPL